MATYYPRTISQAINLAKLIESKLLDNKSKFHKTYPNTFNRTLPFHKIAAIPINPLAADQKLPSSSQPTKILDRKLSSTQLQERIAHGLCFNCDEKFVVDHKCITSRFLLLLAEEEVFESVQVAESPQETVADSDFNDTYFQLSPQALTDQFSPQTLKFQGYIGGIPVMVLVETGSTHNILQPQIYHHLNPPTKLIP